MTREEVIAAFRRCGLTGACSDRCPYNKEGQQCFQNMRHDVLELLKEQEPVKPVVNCDEWVCGCCGLALEQQRMIHPGAIFHDFFEYCPHCGKKVDWEAVNQDGVR